MFATLSKIIVYPIKSLPGVEVAAAQVLRDGALEYDRRWAIVDRAGKFINAKRSPRLHEFDLAMDETFQRLTLMDRRTGRTAVFDFPNQRAACEAWLGESLNLPLQLLENEYVGSPDDLEAPGPTVISTQSLATVASWFDLPLDEIRRRFRANLELNAGEPFAEDRLVASNLDEVTFCIGEVTFSGMKACQRCPVPTRNSATGVELAGFVKTFTDRRMETFPSFAPRDRFTHFYRLAVNTRLISRAGTLRVGDPVTIIDAD